MEKKLISTNSKDLTVFTKVEQNILNARKSAKIGQCSEAEVSKLLLSIMALLGIPPRNIPGENEFKGLVSNTIMVLDNYTIDEVGIAFKLALKGEIDYSLNLYDRIFNIAFISDLMIKYKEYRANVIDKKLKSETLVRGYSEQEIKQMNDDSSRNNIKRAYNFYKEKKVFEFEPDDYVGTMIYVGCYDYLRENKLYSPAEILIDKYMKLGADEYGRYLRIRRSECAGRRDRNGLEEVKALIQNWEETMKVKEFVILNYAKALLFKKYISDNVEMDIEIEL